MAISYAIVGLVRAEKMNKLPEGLMHRRSKYDSLIEDAKVETVKITLTNTQKALNVYLALRHRIKQVAKGKVVVGMRGRDLYAFPAKYVKSLRN